MKRIIFLHVILPITLCWPLQNGLARETTSAQSSANDAGLASYYHDKFHGRRTASGHTYNKHDLTAAHRHLPLGSQVRVTNLKNRRSVVVRITDRGPRARKRVIDVSRAAAKKLGMIASGLAQVKIEPVEQPLNN